ncbi:hypothetical protein TVAG_351140 [Trichomonas vaginalis G3]|uniref:Uncharacterized protein n=1 Tax=Trichomonas vaginalis (strain ATCC PRA-98 / G3) TaxID=412133 RepID=A2FZJ4_TRIV3|nr:hypothetical protein TVAGG3_0009890 [Trichomonas vaginalis G3]EAX89673.1 hypothetical protein TVAG_351140 [Trichomonas vaginalis G3]KAI5539086.1 hypothetical protein TVAGG3_0009890 [Trichomonas vaginalis G3]|eukprot:XP_001302603.1 hypothetical protein [Trichomonas vaginalis G3]
MNASESNIIADAIIRNMYIEFTKGNITPLHIISFNSRTLYESFVIILTSISNNSQISFQDQYIPVENLIFDYIIGNFPSRYISFQNEDKTNESFSVLTTGFLEETQTTHEKYKYILSLTDSENLPYELLSIYANLIPKFTPSSKQFKEIMLHLRMTIKCIIEISNSSSILMKLISFINSCQNSYIIIPLCSIYLTLIADFYYMEELYLSKFYETILNIFTKKEDKRRMTALLNHFSIFYCVTFMRSIISLEQFPNHLEMANENPVLFALKCIISNIDCMSQLHSFNKDFPFLFIKPNTRNKANSERFLLCFIDKFNQIADYLILPSFSRAFFQMANFVGYRIDCSFLSSHLLRRMIDHIKDGQLDNRYYSLVTSSDIMLSDMLSHGISKQLAMNFVQALFIATTDSDEEFFIKSFFLATKYFLEAKPFSFAIFHALISNFVRLPHKALSHDIYQYVDFIASCFQVIQSSSYKMPLNPYSSLIASIKMIIEKFRGKENIKVVDSMISQIFVSFFNSSEKLPFGVELITIFEKYLEGINELPEIPRTFLTIFPPFFNKVNETSEHLAAVYINCLVSIGNKEANFIFSCELLVDILFKIQEKTKFMPIILRFFDHQFSQDRDRQKRNEEYAFFINNYKKKCANINFDDDQDFLLVRGGDPYLWFRRRNGIIQISSSNITGSSKYCIDFESNCKLLPFDRKCCKKQADLLNESWGILTPAKPIGILVDMMNDFAHKEFQVADDIQLFAPSMKKIFSRNLKTTCKANILYVNSDKFDKAADVSKFSPDFISFLKSLGKVKFFEKSVEITCDESQEQHSSSFMDLSQ